MASLVLVDDHALLRKGLSLLVKALGYHVQFEAGNGADFIRHLNPEQLPDLVLMDISMPEMDGFETMAWLKKHYPEQKVLVLSMYDDENAVIRMIQHGARGYVLKEATPAELKAAIREVLEKGYHYSDLVSGRLIHTVSGVDDEGHEAHSVLHLKEKEILFLKLVCTELTYKEIAEQMQLSPRTVDSYRDLLFEKLHVKTRTGLAIFAIRHGIVKV